MTAVQLLWVNMIMDTLGALALATEPPTDELMNRPPIGRNANFISKAMWRNILGQSVYQFTVLAVLSFNGERLLRLTGSDSQAILNTVIFNTFVFCQVFLYPCLFSSLLFFHSSPTPQIKPLPNWGSRLVSFFIFDLSSFENPNIVFCGFKVFVLFAELGGIL